MRADLKVLNYLAGLFFQKKIQNDNSGIKLESAIVGHFEIFSEEVGRPDFANFFQDKPAKRPEASCLAFWYGFFFLERGVRPVFSKFNKFSIKYSFEKKLTKENTFFCISQIFIE